MEEAQQKNEFWSLYTTLWRLSGKTKPIRDNIHKTDGSFVHSDTEHLQRWQEFFQQLLNHQKPHDPPAAPPDLSRPQDLASEEAPSLEEVKRSIKMLKNGKAAGADGITAEAIKAGGHMLAERLHLLILTIWSTEHIPTAWKKAIIMPILKKGDNRDCTNYRGISLLLVTGKVFMRILQTHLQRHHEQLAREEQGGFHPYRSCCDQIFTLRQLMEEWTWCGKRTMIVFIDFRAAFDSVHWPALWRALEAEHVPTSLVRLVNNTYSNCTSCVRIKNACSEDFTVRSGVQQGCVLSHLLFNVVINAIMRTAFNGRWGVKLSKNDYVTDLMFADDSAIFANSDAEATDILYAVASAARPYGLQINSDKTKAMTTDGSSTTVHLDGKQIEQVQQFKYLGSIVQERKVASTAEVHSRIGLATATFSALNWCLWKKQSVSLQTKIHVFRATTIAVLLYGAETWTLLQADLNKLEVFQM
uniref:Reverse transcriptase domain-containing protein n=1 Tax=Plectus sambesii TaxID=2011161 RepID=A0A914VWC6_9BILA